MNSVKLASMTGLALLLAACGGASSEEPAAEETTVAPAAEETATPTEEATPAASETPSASATPSEAAAKPSATSTPTASATVAAAAAATAPVGFNMCKACHSVEKGKHGIGPSLAGIYGTKAGDIPGYEFSKPMKESGLKWDEATLDKYLTDPRGTVPGTKMSFAGLKDEAKRKDVIAYLKSLK
ncbi:MAG TPA: c-type cytochrome [Sphingomonadaceae bacterium]|nr:c-type cytochrome [Sphingomonadaceae bacterium]